MNHAKASFSTEIFAGAIIGVVQYLALLQYSSDTAASLQYLDTQQWPHTK
jgi:hypothetical protein